MAASNNPFPKAGDNPRIDVNQDRDLHDWSKKLDATPEQIKEAVQAVGDRADKVEAHLKGSRATTNGSDPVSPAAHESSRASPSESDARSAFGNTAGSSHSPPRNSGYAVSRGASSNPVQSGR